jgi:eukaryotic-like serine/threonine-protein kinase
MLTGKRAFQKATSAETMTAILNEDPPAASQLAPNLPPGLQRILNRCLAKSPEQRIQHATDLAFALEALSDSSSTATPAVRQAVSSKKWISIAAAVVAITIAIALILWWRQPPPVPVVESITQLTDDGEPKPFFTKVVTDGSRVYFNEGTIISLKIAQVAATGGPTALIPTSLGNPQIAGLAPAGSAVLAIGAEFGNVGYPLWQVPLPAGEPRRLDTLEANDAEFLPDGRIIFAQGADLYLAEKDGSNARKLVSVDGLIGQPSVSPDGQRLVFTLYSRSSIELYTKSGIAVSIVEARADGSALHPIVNTSGGGRVCCTQWTPDGRYIVFQNEHEGRRDLWVFPMNAGFFQRAREPVQLTNGPLSYMGPVVSRDGKQIFAVGSKQRGELVYYDTKSNQFLPFLSGISGFNLTVSRDGQWVAYTSYPDGNLWRSRADGTDRLQLTYPPLQVYAPFISPDGKRVAYGNSKGETYVISMDGGPPQRVVENHSSYANWSPDGNFLVFNDTYDAAHVQLRVLDLRTGIRSVVPGSQDIIGGQWVAEDLFVAAPQNLTKLLVFDVKTQRWSDLVPGTVPGAMVNWAHSLDYKSVYYTTGAAEPKAMRVRLADHKVETIASLKDLRRAVGPDGNTQISVAPDGSAVFTRDIGTQEIYVLSVKWP